MIGLFDSGAGGLTVLRELTRRFPDVDMLYFGDHANAPYGDRPADEVIALTKDGVCQLFDRGCRLVLLACNTATAVACRQLQQHWLPGSGYEGHNILGIVAPTVEAATQVPWAVTTPQYPQKYNTETIGVFATQRTVLSGVYPEEIGKRCPQVSVIQQACPMLVRGIEGDWPTEKLDAHVESYVADLLDAARNTQRGELPERIILGCTHYPLLAAAFKRALPSTIRLLAQPQAVSDSLEDYLGRHPHYATRAESPEHRNIRLVTSGDPARPAAALQRFWPDIPAFVSLDQSTSTISTP
ncbi:MAG: aspartate/glutamate racemase family protein [Pseudomonadota bacterium]